MIRKRAVISAILSAAGMIILVLDSKTAIAGATEGIDICIRTIIPSLLPFFILSSLLTSTVAGVKISFLRPIGRLCGIPHGAEYLLLTGFIGGYPVGAQAIAEAYKSGAISSQDAKRMLGFCNNAGPAFIFGIAGALFDSKSATLLLWLIHIASAILVAMILPRKRTGSCTLESKPNTPFPTILSNSLRVMAGVCGWVILFRIIIAFLCRWLLWLFPDPITLFIIGILELANGCYNLFETQSEILRFVISSVILGFGGICVGMQTVSVTGDLGTGLYFPGKLLQALFSAMLSVATALWLFGGYISTALPVLILAVLLFIFVIIKKTVAFLDNRVYNNQKERSLCACCFERK